MFQIKFLGTGSAFTMPAKGVSLDECDWQSNLLVTAESGKKLLLDCGSDVRFSLREQGLSYADIDALYLSHLHADHIGGMEWLAFSTYFDPKCKRPSLFCASTIAGPLWSQSLRGGLESIEGKIADITEYFDLRRIPKNGYFVWEGIRFELVQVVHVMAERTIKHSYGLMIMEDGKESQKIFWTSDTQFCPNQIKKFYADASLILQDCETCPPEFKSGVHAHWCDLRTLQAVKAKMHLYHYQPGGPITHDAIGEGFGGFIRKGDVFTMLEDGTVISGGFLEKNSD